MMMLFCLFLSLNIFRIQVRQFRDSLLFSSVQCCFMSTETLRTVRDGEPRKATSTFTQLLSLVQCCFMSTETTKTVRDGDSRKATSTFTQLLSLVQCCFMSTETTKTVRDGEPGWPPRLSHSSCALCLSLSTVFKFSVALRPQRPYGLLGTGSPGWPPRLSHT